jgi:hypothetical protein
MEGASAAPLVGLANTAVGLAALSGLEGEASNNTGIGADAGSNNTTGTDNTLVGYAAGAYVTGNFNVMLGEDPDGAITSGSSNILIGNSLTKVTDTASNQIDIGDVITVTGAGTPSTSNTTIQGNLIIDGGLSASTAIFSSGQLQCGGSNCNNSTGSSTLSYCPYKGNLKTTASQGTYTIPSGCLTASTGGMYVGGAAGSLSGNKLYYIYLWNKSGTGWVLDAESPAGSPPSHEPDSTTGIEIKTGDNTKTLVGMIETNTNGYVFTGGETNVAGDTNTVATWDNRQSTTTTCHITGSSVTISSNTPELISDTDECLFMSWGDAAQFSSNQTGYVNTTENDPVTTAIYLDEDSSTTASSLEIYPYYNGVGGYYTLLVAPSAYAPTEGYHYTTLYGSVAYGSVTYISSTPTFVSTIQ